MYVYGWVGGWERGGDVPAVVALVGKEESNRFLDGWGGAGVFSCGDQALWGGFGWVGGWVGWMEEDEAVGMRCCGL